ncbi:MAG: glycoside hydrolase family 127 protein [Eubacteriales bacterium]|jgi:DUF1680 family protein
MRKEISLDDITMNGGFWAQKQKLCRERTIPAVYSQFSASGRIGAFDFSTPYPENRPPHIFWDSDVAKWMEGACYQMIKHPDPELLKKVETLIDQIERYQAEDGYFNLYFQRVEPGKRFSNRSKHELYCAGHLMEAAVAYYELTGSLRFISIMEKYADLIDRVFRIEKSAAFLTPGHEEIELALFRMYCATKNEKYLRLALYFLEMRGNNEIDFAEQTENRAYNQSHLPVREQREAAGHAVRALYLYTAMADAAIVTGDESLKSACIDLYRDITRRKMYITGGLGSTPTGEAFTLPYDLPNRTAYAETCASVGMVFFCHRMMQLDPENAAEYADTIERELYNGILSGISLDGSKFFYENPLEFRVSDRYRNTSTTKRDRFPSITRSEIFSCSCCPPNICRLLPSVGKYIITNDGEGSVSIWQFADCEAKSGNATITMKTDFPASGKVSIICRGVKRLSVRIPAWCRSYATDTPARKENRCLIFDNPQTVSLYFDMPARLVSADPRNADCAGKAAVMRGPLVYCAEGIDNENKVFARTISRMPDFKEGSNAEFGVPTISANGYLRAEGDDLYPDLTDRGIRCRIHLIPYFAMENRGKTDMVVWLPIGD